MLKVLTELLYAMTHRPTSQSALGQQSDIVQLEKSAEEKEAERKKANQEAYNSYRDHVWALRQGNFDKADNMILTLSSALLTFSLAFLKDIVTTEKYQGAVWLYSSWSFLGAAVAICFVSFFFSRRSMDVQLDQAHDYYIDDNDHAFSKGNRYTAWTEVCNIAAASCFLLGIGLTIFSVSTNLNGAIMASNSSKGNSGGGSGNPINRGATPPKPQPKGKPDTGPSPLTGATPPSPPPKK